MRGPRRAWTAARCRWQALMASTPWARLRALEAQATQLAVWGSAGKAVYDLGRELADLSERLEKLSASPYQWEERLEDLGRDIADIKQVIECVDLDGLERLDPDDLEDLPRRVEELEGEVLTLKDEMPNEDSMSDAAEEAVSGLAKRLHGALDDILFGNGMS